MGGLSLAPLGWGQTEFADLALLFHDYTLSSIQLIISVLSIEKILFEAVVTLDMSLTPSQGPTGRLSYTQHCAGARLVFKMFII